MSGETIFFRDAIEGIGLSFAEVWPHYLATITVLDLDGGDEASALPRHSVLATLPGSGTPPQEDLPEGLGFVVFHVPAALGMAGSDLRVQIDGDASVPWHAVVARTDGVTPGSAVLDYVVATWDDAGHGELLLPAFDGSRDAFIAVSPESPAKGPFAHSISAELVPTDAGDSSTSTADTTAGIDGTTAGETGSESGATTGAGDDASGCSCRSTGRPGWALLLPLLALGARRRRR
jgi:MYXO-CTERM domain-containing protein